MASKPPSAAGATRRLLRAVAKDVLETNRRVQLSTVAASLAYTTLLSIIPVLAVSFAVFHAFGGMEKLLETVEPYILSNLAHGTGVDVTQALRQFIDNVHATTVGAGGLAGLVVTTMLMLYSAESAINQIWGITSERHILHRISFYWMFVTLGPLALAVAVGVATSGDTPLSDFLPRESGVFLLTVALLFCVYQFVPKRAVDPRCAFIAAGVTAAIGTLAASGYEVYTKKAVSYNKIYGSLGAIPILLVWIYIMWLITLSGAALTAALQKRLDEPAD